VAKSDPLEYVEVSVAPTLAAQTSTRCPSDPASIRAAMERAFGELMTFFARHGTFPVGPPRTIYTGHGPEGTEFTVAFPVGGPPAAAPEGGPVTVGPLPAGKAHRFTHRGPYPGLGKTYEGITGWLKERGLIQNEADWVRFMPMWEEYVNDPRATPEADLVTYIYLPI
jgi:effector-binding domain-containing protein